MRCHELPVSDIVDDALAPSLQAPVASHLATCVSCRTLVADLRAIRAAAFTLDRREVPAELFERLAAHSPAAGRWRLRARLAPAPWFGWRSLAAAVVLVAGVGLGVAQLARPAAGPAQPDALQADLRAADAQYDQAIRGLEQMARSDAGVLAPEVAAVLQANLEVVDRAIGESRAALRAEPASPAAREGLFDAMRAKLALLQQTIELINEMRKGNQAEAGRLMQDLPR